MSDSLENDHYCFGCGPLNPIGLKLTFEWDGDRYSALWTPQREHQGWAGRVHGGLLALVLDEALSRAALERHGLVWVTAELTTRLKQPANIGEPLSISAWITSVRPRLIACAGEIRTHDGRLVATGQAKMMQAKMMQAKQQQQRRATLMEPAQPQTPYLQSGEGVETPLETAARLEALQSRSGGQARQEELEADLLVADIDQYVAQTDPASLPEAERELDAWQIPTDPLEGVPGNVTFEPNVEGEPLVPIFSAQTESEANIVRGLVEASGIPATINTLSSPALGGVFQPDETRWGDILVSASEAEAARTAIAEATATGSEIETNTQEAYYA